MVLYAILFCVPLEDLLDLPHFGFQMGQDGDEFSLFLGFHLGGNLEGFEAVDSFLLLAGPELGTFGDLFASDIVATLDDGLSLGFGEVAMYPVVDSGGRQVELVGDLGHGEVGGFLEVFQDFLSVGAMVATVV